MNFPIETEQEDDGRWIAEIAEIPGVMTYGTTVEDAVLRVQTLAISVLEERTYQDHT